VFYTIYKITNKINNKFYIGMHKTDNLDDGYMGSGKLIKYAITKYGAENFSKEILHVFDNEKDMRDKEKELVVISEQSYNLLEGGKGGFGYINSKGLNGTAEGKKLGGLTSSKKETNPLYNLSEESIKTRVKTRKQIYGIQGYTEIARKTCNDEQAMIKRKQTFESIGHQRGKNNSQYGTCWINNGKENKKIKKENIDKYIELGYYKGRIKNWGALRASANPLQGI
jgi:hypothetical protein